MTMSDAVTSPVGEVMRIWCTMTGAGGRAVGEVGKVARSIPEGVSISWWRHNIAPDLVERRRRDPEKSVTARQSRAVSNRQAWRPGRGFFPRSGRGGIPDGIPARRHGRG